MGPDYEVPSSIVTGRYKGGQLRAVRPLDGVPQGEWWTIFRDSELNRLQREALRHSETLKGAVARYDQARAQARLAKAEFLPRVDVGVETDYLITSENQASAFPLVGLRYDGGSYRTPVDFNWELDLWGKIRRENEAAVAEAYAAGNAMQHALLSLHAEVAMTYFQIRARDAEIVAVTEAVALRRDAVRIAAAQVNAGTTTDLVKVQAETELEVARSELAALQDQRSQLLNALAILTGAQPAAFALKRRGSKPNYFPKIPAGVPSDLLERRPDIAAAERRLAAATARVGVAKAAAYPSVQLTGLAGYDSGDVELLLEPLSFFATIGPRVNVPIFSGGRNKANQERATARHA
ncbi:MAG: efflux transporter outer membrane subunit, partial [Planctomycetota bacterium]